jgi:tetratricopeptide (TPR) repeat protein
MKPTALFIVTIFFISIGTLSAQENQRDYDRLENALEVLNSKDYTNAEELINEYLSSYPNDEFALNGLGIIKYRQGKIDTAIELYNRSISINPDFLEAYENRANSKVDNGDISGALKDINYAISHDSLISSAFINRGRILLVNQDTISAFIDFEKGIKLGSTAPEAYSNRGICYWYQKKLELALEDLRYVISKHPNYSYAHANYGIVQIEGLNDIPNANISFLTAYDLGLRDELVIYNLGYTSQLLGKLNEAFRYYSEYIKNDSSDSDVFFNRGTILAYQKKYDLSLHDFETSLRLDPQNTGVLTNRALLVYEPNGDLTKAIGDMQEVIQIQESSNTNPAFAYNNLGFLQLKNGDLEKAGKNVKHSIKLNPANSYAYKNLALIGIEQGDLDSACNATQKAIELGFIAKYGNKILSIKESACRNEKK